MAIVFATSFADVGKVFAAYVNINAFVGNGAPSGGYKFTVTAVTTAPTAGATYTNNGFTYTIIADVKAAGTTVAAAGNGAPSASGTLTKASGTGDATITYSAVTQYSNWIDAAVAPTSFVGPVIKTQNTMVNDILARLELSGLTPLIPFQNWQTTISGMDSSVQSQKSVLGQLAQQIVIQRVNNDVPQQNASSFQQAITEWIRQMQSQTSSVKQATVSSSVSAGAGNTGTATPYASLFDANGLLLEYSYAETMIMKCTQDQFTGATAGSEQITLTTKAQATSNLSYLWPGGSGLTSQLTVVDPTQGYGNGQNLIGGGSTTVGAFKAWTSSVPDGWTILLDGGNISDGTSSAYAGLAHCLKFAGNTGGTNATTALYQTFANGSITGGSTITLLPNTVYQFYAKVKADVVPAAGAISFSLVNGSNAVVNNNAGNANTITTTVSGYGGTTYQTITGTFQTPTIMPTNIRLLISATTHITTGSNVFVDYVALTQPASQNYGGLYQGGPYVSVFRGDVDCVNYVSPTIGDTWSAIISNNYGSTSSTILNFNALFNQLFGMASLGLILPSSGSPTIADSLIS